MFLGLNANASPNIEPAFRKCRRVVSDFLVCAIIIEGQYTTSGKVNLLDKGIDRYQSIMDITL